jgi:phosphohistidine phosphatase
VYGAAAEQLLDLVHQAPRVAKTLLIVGHDPGIPGLAFMLAGPAAPGSGAVPRSTVDRMKAKFPTAAVAVLELTGSWDQLGPGAAWLTGFVTPREASAGGPGGARA